MNKAILIVAFTCLRADAFETTQLPLSEDMAKTFPEISSSCYIIVNEDTNVVVTSSNSETPIDTGTFSEMYDVAQLATLHEMAKQFTDKFGTIICKELLMSLANIKKDVSMPEKRTPEYYKVRPCERFVVYAAELTEKMLNGEL